MCKANYHFPPTETCLLLSNLREKPSTVKLLGSDNIESLRPWDFSPSYQKLSYHNSKGYWLSPHASTSRIICTWIYALPIWTVTQYFSFDLTQQLFPVYNLCPESIHRLLRTGYGKQLWNVSRGRGQLSSQPTSEARNEVGNESLSVYVTKTYTIKSWYENIVEYFLTHLVALLIFSFIQCSL